MEKIEIIENGFILTYLKNETDEKKRYFATMLEIHEFCKKQKNRCSKI